MTSERPEFAGEDITMRLNRIRDVFRRVRNPHVDDLGNLTADDLSFFLQHTSCTDSQRRFILSLADRAEIRPQISQGKEASVTEIPPLPSSEVMARSLAPLEHHEVIRRLQEFCEDIRNGKIVVLLRGNNTHANNIFTHAESLGIKKFRVSKRGSHTPAEVPEEPPAAETALYSDKLVPGYQRARRLLDQRDFINLFLREIPLAQYIPDGGFAWQADRESLDPDQKLALRKQFEGSPDNERWMRGQRSLDSHYYYLRTKIIHLFPAKKKLVAGIENRSVVAQVKTSPVYATDMVMSLRAADPGSGRSGAVYATLLFLDNGGAVSTREVLRGDTPQNKETSRFAYYLQALACYPGFLLDGLRLTIPEMLQAADSSKSFYPTQKEQVSIEINVPELQLLGQSSRAVFTQI